MCEIRGHFFRIHKAVLTQFYNRIFLQYLHMCVLIRFVQKTFYKVKPYCSLIAYLESVFILHNIFPLTGTISLAK